MKLRNTDAESPAGPVAALRDVSLRYDNGLLALDGLSLEVQAGEFVSLLGPSGCGKSTALRLIAGLLQPSSGAVWRQEELNAAPGGAATDIGFVFQDPTLMPWARLLANVRLPLDLAGVPRSQADARAASMLARVGLAGFERAFPRELSGGMRMRASIARALAIQPRLLLMDEPFAALDELTRFRLNDDLLALRTEVGFTVVFVTHSTWESVYLSDRIVTLSGRPGRVVSETIVSAPDGRGSAFRASPDYARQCAAVFEVMNRAYTASGASV